MGTETGEDIYTLNMMVDNTIILNDIPAQKVHSLKLLHYADDIITIKLLTYNLQI